MGVKRPVAIPFPLSSFPGQSSQESEGRLINCYCEPLGETSQNKYKYIRSAGLSLQAATMNSGYRGGMAVNNESFVCWNDNASTVDSAGNVTSIGPFPGTKKVSIARNQASPTPDVIAVDLDNGAYVIGSATVVPATATITIGGTFFNQGDIVNLIFTNPYISAINANSFPVTITHTLGAGETAASVASALNTAINANAVLIAANLTSTVLGAVITVDHQGSIGNQTSVIYSVTGTATPASVSLGTGSSTSGATCAITGVNAPAGSLIAVCVVETSHGVGSIADGVNTGNYNLAASEPFNSGAYCGAIFYFENSAALAAATITYTKSVSGSTVEMSAFYISGAAASSVLDPSVTALATGSSTYPSVTSGIVGSAIEVLVGAVMCAGAPTYTQASGFSTPPVLSAASTTVTVAGGVAFNGTNPTMAFSPTLGTSEQWAAIIVGFKAGSGQETVTLSPTSGNLAGGQGTYGAFSGVPTAYSGQGAMLEQANSVCFQDGYFFLTAGNGTVYATVLNGLLMNALTYITVQAKADVTLLRGIPFAGLLMFFTTGSCEVWQDAALPAPNFPYSRLVVLEFGLLQPTAIAGWETGFSELLWVAQDFGVHWMTSGTLAETKVSPPDLDRLIEAEAKAGNTLESGVYIAGGKKFWTLSSPDWTWEFNLQSKKWNERQSLVSPGVYGRWRGTGAHPAFGRWIVGDEQSGDLLYTDDMEPTEVGSPMLSRLESGPVKNFPAQDRVARADFDFVVGVGQAVGSVTTIVTDAAAGTDGVIRLGVFSSVRMTTGDVASVSGVAGTTEANGKWSITVVDETHIELQGSVFANAYSSGGVVIDLTSPANAQAPQVAISMSKDGGQTWGNPLLRPLGAQGKVQRSRVSVTNMGLSGPMGVRWRLDITDAVYVSFMGGTQSSDIRMVGT